MNTDLPIHIGDFECNGLLIDVSISREVEPVIHFTMDAETFPLNPAGAVILVDFLLQAVAETNNLAEPVAFIRSILTNDVRGRL